MWSGIAFVIQRCGWQSYLADENLSEALRRVRFQRDRVALRGSEPLVGRPARHGVLSSGERNTPVTIRSTLVHGCAGGCKLGRWQG
jgi:hypothetical protein